jgi:hypothetical protein
MSDLLGLKRYVGGAAREDTGRQDGQHVSRIVRRYGWVILVVLGRQGRGALVVRVREVSRGSWWQLTEPARVRIGHEDRDKLVAPNA